MIAKVGSQVTEQIVADYLVQHPDFFLRHPALLASLRLQEPQRGVVSLVERQQQVLRQKVQGLEEEITHLMSTAQQNERLFFLYSDMYMRMIDCQSAQEIIDCIHQACTQLLSLADCKLWLIDKLLDHQNVITNDCYGVLQNRLTKNDYYFGRLQQSEQEMIFTEPTTGSVVLIKLENGDETLGFIAISSQDADHFDPTMDTLLLEQFRKLVGKLLGQHLQAK
ncbi:DUF484 family protein [Thalassotalea sp. LPB0316]|nr:DUF484 family protein [Thalassotalea sp. LPB0316]